MNRAALSRSRSARAGAAAGARSHAHHVAHRADPTTSPRNPTTPASSVLRESRLRSRTDALTNGASIMSAVAGGSLDIASPTSSALAHIARLTLSFLCASNYSHPRMQPPASSSSTDGPIRVQRSRGKSLAVSGLQEIADSPFAIGSMRRRRFHQSKVHRAALSPCRMRCARSASMPPDQPRIRADCRRARRPLRVSAKPTIRRARWLISRGWRQRLVEPNIRLTHAGSSA